MKHPFDLRVSQITPDQARSRESITTHDSHFSKHLIKFTFFLNLGRELGHDGDRKPGCLNQGTCLLSSEAPNRVPLGESRSPKSTARLPTYGGSSTTIY